MKNIRLTTILKEITSDKELDAEIEQYFSNQKELAEKKKAIQKEMDDIIKSDKSLKQRFTKIQKYMVANDVQEKKVKSWIAKLKTVAKYARITPDYKTLWKEALEKVNEATRRVMNGLEEAQKETKKAATKIELELKNEGVVDIFKSLWSKFTKLFGAFDNYKKVTNTLPKLDGLKEISTTRDIAGYGNEYFLKKDKKTKK